MIAGPRDPLASANEVVVCDFTNGKSFNLYRKASIMRRFAYLIASVLPLLLADTVALGQLIDFESTPDGVTPIDDASLATPYPIGGPDSVRFFFDRPATPLPPLPPRACATCHRCRCWT